MGITSQAALELVLRARDEASATVKRFNDALDETGESTEGAGDKAEGLAGIMDGLGLAITAAGVVAAAGATYEFGRMGAEAERGAARFEAFSGSSEEAAANLAALEEATRGAVSEQTLMAEGAIFLQTGLARDTEEMAKLVGMAMTLGKANESAEEKISNFSLMLLNTSIPRMDSYGMSGATARGRIAELQAATEGLSREEAFKIAVMEQGATAMARLGDVAEDNLLAYEQFEASLENLKTTMATATAGPVAGLVKGLTTALETVQLLVEWNDQLADATLAQGAAVEETAGSYEEYIAELERSSEAAGLVVNAEGDLVRMRREQVHAASGMIQTTEELVQANFALSEVQFDVARSVAEMGDAISGTPGELRGMYEASETAGESLEGLATSAGKVAKSFGEMHYDNESLWNMALASGASEEALVALAQQLGIATEAEIENTLAAYDLIEAFKDGEISEAQLEAGFARLAMAEQRATIEAAKATGGLEYLRGGMMETADAAGGVIGGLGGIEAAANRAAEAARRAAAAFAAIGHAGQAEGLAGAQQEYQHGVASAPGGIAMVGEAGRELVFLPRGARVVPNDQTERMLGGRVTFNETVVIQDTASMAMFLESRTEAGLRQLSDSVM